MKNILTRGPELWVCGKPFLVKIDSIFFSQPFEETLSKGEEYSEDGPEKMLTQNWLAVRGDGFKKYMTLYSLPEETER